jgi:hypothetical protein
MLDSKALHSAWATFNSGTSIVILTELLVMLSHFARVVVAPRLRLSSCRIRNADMILDSCRITDAMP